MNNKEFLKNNLKLIEIETFSYCNRKCWFCPNSKIDRISKNIEMPEDLYLSVLDQLSEIDFAGEITYSRYNEPLSHSELILKRISQAKKKVPNAILRTNSNGDYVTLDLIKKLHKSGLSQLWIQQYLSNNEKYNHLKLKSRIEKKIKKLNLNYEKIIDIEDCKLEYNLFFDGMTIHIRSRNFEMDGSSRGNLVQLGQNFTRTQKCKQVFNNMYIDYNGKVMVCCALRSDSPEHSDAIMGDSNKQKIWDIFASEKYFSWRDHHKQDGPKEGFCKTCKDSISPIYNKV